MRRAPCFGGSAITRETLIKPPRLVPGGLIGIVSPAGPVRPADLRTVKERLEALGYGVRIGPHALERRGYLAGNDTERLSDLLGMFRDPSVGAVLCARGGYGTLRLVNRLPYAVFRRHPKPLVGFSDVTALLMALYRRTGLVTFHGPMCGQLASPEGENLRHLLQMLRGDGERQIDLSGGETLIGGKVRGRLLGGNLSLICHLLGTPYAPALAGAVLFVEEVDEPAYRLDRMLTHLALSGRLRRLAGLILGQFEKCADFAAVNRLFTEALAGLGVPLVSGLAVGHGPLNRTLPVGIKAELDADRRRLTLLESWVG